MYKETGCGSRECTELKEVSEKSLGKVKAEQQRLPGKRICTGPLAVALRLTKSDTIGEVEYWRE
jgi:hypothetical protein